MLLPIGQGLPAPHLPAPAAPSLAAPFASVQAAPDAAWVWFTDPRAVYHNGQTFFAYVDSGGLEKVRAFNHTTLTFTAEFTLKNIGELDDHDNPSLLVRASDSRLLTWYNQHDGSHVYQRLSTNPDDATAWGAEVDIASSLGLGTDAFDYGNPIQLSGESGRIYLSFRHTAAHRMIAQAHSDDGGATWSALTDIYYGGGSSINYFKAVQNGSSRIDYVVTNGSPAWDGTVSIYHFYYQGGSYYKSDGTLITASLPFGPADVTLVYNGTAHNAGNWQWDIAPDAAGHPLLLWASFPNGNNPDDMLYFYARWTGSAWTVNQIVDAGGPGIGSDLGENYYAGGLIFDHTTPSIVYLSRLVAGQWELWRYATPDGGVTWGAQPITQNSAAKNTRPIYILNHAPGFPILWLLGRYTRSDNLLQTAQMLYDPVAASAATGTVTSVGLTMPAEFSVSGTPVTGAGTLAVTKANESANTVFAGPTSGGAAAPAFRAAVAADMPNTAVTPGTYTNATITVDQQGHLTAAASGAGGGELLVNDGVSSPPTALYTEDGTDFLYQG